MASSTSPPESSEPPRQLIALWAGILAGPSVWAALLQTNYVLSYVACEQRQSWMLHLATLAALALVGLAGFTAWRATPGPNEEQRERGGAAATTALRRRFMALAGLALCGWFAVVIMAMEIPALVLHPCTP